MLGAFISILLIVSNMVQPRRRLPQYAVDALETLWVEAERQNCTGFSRPTAHSLLADDTDLELPDVDIEHTLDLLRQRGELYLADDRLKITGLVMEEPPPSER
jgi:hypothetical protein